ncbi:MAG TPA: hypothetical protein PK082_11020 [Phycisphaerae bacterium]|nr:hypothetical protein [Phycisphaerae bacterium]
MIADALPAAGSTSRSMHLLDLIRVRWSNWKNRRVAKAYRTMADVLQRDCGYADAWQANIAMPILDGAGGKLTHAEANAIADRLMAHLWGVAPRSNVPVRRAASASPSLAGSPMTDLPWGCPYCGKRFKYAEEGIVHSDNCKRSPANAPRQPEPAAGDRLDAIVRQDGGERVPEADRKMIFHVCQKLAVVLGLNAQEQAWLESLGATFPQTNAQAEGRS